LTDWAPSEAESSPSRKSSKKFSDEKLPNSPSSPARERKSKKNRGSGETDAISDQPISPRRDSSSKLDQPPSSRRDSSSKIEATAPKVELQTATPAPASEPVVAPNVTKFIPATPSSTDAVRKIRVRAHVRLQSALPPKESNLNSSGGVSGASSLKSSANSVSSDGKNSNTTESPRNSPTPRLTPERTLPASLHCAFQASLPISFFGLNRGREGCASPSNCPNTRCKGALTNREILR